MAVFRDNDDREWSVEISVYDLEQLKTRLGIDMTESSTEPIQKLITDPYLMVNALYVLCEDQCKDRGMSDVDFGKMFKGDTLDGAFNALETAIVDFFRTPAQRKAMRRLMDTSGKISEGLTQAAMNELDQVDVEQVIDQLSKSLTGSPAS